MIVPAKVKLLSVAPRRVAWSGTVRITGQLVGGYLPAGWCASAVADRSGLDLSDLWRAGACDRQRPLLDDVHIRRRGREDFQRLLVPDRIVADGLLSISPRRIRPAEVVTSAGHPTILLPLKLDSNMKASFER